MLAFILGLLLLFLYVCVNSKDKIGFVDVMGVVGLLCIAWGMSRYAGMAPKPLWDPN